MVLLRAERDYKGDMEALSLEIEQVWFFLGFLDNSYFQKSCRKSMEQCFLFFQVVEKKVTELERKRVELESSLVNMLREKLEKNER